MSYRKVWLLGACAYIFRRNLLLNLPYFLSACAYRELLKASLFSLTYKTFSIDVVARQTLTEDSYTISIQFRAWFRVTEDHR